MRILEPAMRLRSIRTRRSLLPTPVDRADPQWERSWRHLLETYAPAMRRYVEALLRRSLGGSPGPEEAADVVQDFLASCLEHGWLSKEAGDIRCFRAYLQVVLKRFTWNHVERKKAAKRDPGRPMSDVGLAAVADEASDPAARALDEGLLTVALDAALAALRAGNEAYAEIIADLLRTNGEGSPDLAARLGRAPGDLAVLRHRARKRFATLFADELRATVKDDDAFGDLLKRLEPLVP
jgi:DNA-directed RNA polymerase specialized sigma24 family protein